MKEVMNNLIDVHEYMHALGLLRMPRDCAAAVVVSCVFLCTLFMKFLTISLLLSFMIELYSSKAIWIMHALVIIVIWNETIIINTLSCVTH